MVRGGYWYGGSSDALDSSTRSSFGPSTDNYVNLGFRVASVSIPEPSTYALIGLGALALVIAYRRKTA
jgi:hypothetical protein